VLLALHDLNTACRAPYYTSTARRSQLGEASDRGGKMAGPVYVHIDGGGAAIDVEGPATGG
jgi:hypothetical protein